MVIISTEKLSQIRPSVEEGKLTAGAGTLLKRLCEHAQEAGLSGLEFAYGIPGTVGGAVCMNAGAYGGETAHVFDSALLLDRDGKMRRMTKAEMDFAYRHSAVSEQGLFVLEATFALETGNKAEILTAMNDNIRKRNSRQPVDKPSAGSAFKRPGKDIFAAALIDECGLRGRTIGGAQVSDKHAGFIVNLGNASAADVLALMEHVQGVVFEKKGVRLVPEVVCVMNGGDSKS